MTEAQLYIEVIQDALKGLHDEGHLTGKPSCWHYWVQASQNIESLRTSLLHEEQMKGK